MEPKIKNNNEIIENKLKDVFETKNNFSTPENYFDTLSSDINDKILSKSKKTIFNLSFFTQKRIALSFSVLIFIIAVSVSILYIVKNKNNETIDNKIAQIHKQKNIKNPIVNDSIAKKENDSNKLENKYLKYIKSKDDIDLPADFTDQDIMEYLDEEIDNDIIYEL